MDLNDARNAMQVRVLRELGAIWKKLADDPGAPDDLQAQAREMVVEFKQVVELRDPDAIEHADVEFLLIRMAKYLAKVGEVYSMPEDRKGVLQGEE